MKIKRWDKVDLTTWLLLNLAGGLGWILFRLVNQMEVRGKENLPQDNRKVLICSNHLSIPDSWVIGVAAYGPKTTLFHPGRIFWNAADEKNFFRTKFKRWLFSHLKCIPVSGKIDSKGRTTRDDPIAQRKLLKILEKANLLLFPSGGREQKRGDLAPKEGVGQLVFQKRPKLIPCKIINSDRLFPLDGHWRKNFLKNLKNHQLTVTFGKELDFSQEMKERKIFGIRLTRKRTIYKRITEKIVQAIKNLPAEE